MINASSLNNSDSPYSNTMKLEGILKIASQVSSPL